MVIKDRSGVFKCAASVAPVTNFRYYGRLNLGTIFPAVSKYDALLDSAYTERYMGLPKDNQAGYDVNSNAARKAFRI